MTEQARAVVVGGSVAGVRTVQALATERFVGEIVLIGDESEAVYDRPPLSKAVLAGKAELEDISLGDLASTESAAVQVRLGCRAVSVDVAAQQVMLEDGDRVGYDSLVIATGARVRPSPWPLRPGIHVLRTFADAQALREDMVAGGQLVVIGGGFIGCEVAATARQLGLDVSLVDPLEAPMGRALGAEVGEIFTDLHRRHGVSTYFGQGVQDVTGERGAFRVELTSAAVLDATAVIVGIGSIPEDAWLDSSGLKIDDGVVCDQHGRASGAQNVFAVGDVARWWSPKNSEHHRAEHWTNAVEQAAVVAHNIAHPDDLRAHESSGYVWSDQYDWKIQLAGRTTGLIFETVGDVDAGRFGILYGDDTGRLEGLLTVNWPRAFVKGRQALAGGRSVAELRATLAL